VETINSNLRYASRFYAKPDQFAAEWHNLAVNEGSPHGYAGFILAVDNERWHVTLSGMAGIVPPIDEEGFLKWAQDLPDPSIYEALRIAQPLTPIRGFGTPENHWRHFEQMHGFHCHRRRRLCFQPGIRSGYDGKSARRHDSTAMLAGAPALAQSGL
jgi:hypothetical protein